MCACTCPQVHSSVCTAGLCWTLGEACDWSQVRRGPGSAELAGSHLGAVTIHTCWPGPPREGGARMPSPIRPMATTP